MYWGGCGDFGDRRLDLGGIVGDERLTSKKEYPKYLIYIIDETDDPESGYGYGVPEYCPEHITDKDFGTMHFLHEMYDDIVARRLPEEVEKFIEITKRRGVNMFPYIQSYLHFKNQNQ